MWIINRVSYPLYLNGTYVQNKGRKEEWKKEIELFS